METEEFGRMDWETIGTIHYRCGFLPMDSSGMVRSGPMKMEIPGMKIGELGSTQKESFTGAKRKVIG